MAKPCKKCNATGHSTAFCWTTPRKSIMSRKAVKRVGKQGSKWLRFRAEWFKNHPADHYICYICGDYLTPKETTLDHVVPRSKRPDLRYTEFNIKPCCYRCNIEKGSRSLDKMA